MNAWFMSLSGLQSDKNLLKVMFMQLEDHATFVRVEL